MSTLEIRPISGTAREPSHPDMPASEPRAEHLYTPRFFQVFVAVMLVMVGTSLQYHFGQYVNYRGYSVDVLGRILGISMVGALVIRLSVGRWLDRYGVKPVWLAGTMTAALAAFAIQFVEGATGITALRTLAMMALSSTMTAGTLLAAQIAPVGRRAESIGSIGLAGFLGMIVGPALGDFIFRQDIDSPDPYRTFFSLSAACFAASGLMAVTVRTRSSADGNGTNEPQPRVAPTRTIQMKVIREHWPGVILLMGMGFSMVFTIQTSFLERFAEFKGFHHIKTFFFVYCPTAIVLRVIFRRVPERFGRTRTMLLGAAFMIAGLLSLTMASSEWGLVLPGILMGAGHCFIFPSMVDLSASRLPPEYRGTGTALILGAGDAGMLIGFTTVGEVIDRFGYGTAIVGLAAVFLLISVTVALGLRSQVFRRRIRSVRPPDQKANL